MSYITQFLTVISVFGLSTRGFTISPTATLTPPTSTTTTLRMSTTATTQPTPLAEGLLKTINRKGNGPSLKFGDVATVKFSCNIINDDSTTTAKTFAQSLRQKVVVGDGLMIPGWELALTTMTVGEQSTIRINDSETYGYGAAGVPPIVPRNAIIELEMEILDREDAPTMGTAGAAMGLMSNRGGAEGGATGFFAGGSGDMGILDPSKPRTPQAIAAAYKTRQEQQALNFVPEKEGLEGWIAKAKTYYFFGLFEGETGEKAPWILRPSITFPIVFAVVGVTLTFTVLAGGVSERGIPVKDDLDSIILSLGGVGGLVKDVFV